MNKECRKANKLINSYIDNEISKKDMLFFESHIKSCSACKETYESYKLLIEDISQISMEAPPSDFQSSLHARLVQEADKKRIFVFKPYINVAVSAALIFSVAIGANYYKDYSYSLKNDFAKTEISGTNKTTADIIETTPVVDEIEESKENVAVNNTENIPQNNIKQVEPVTDNSTAEYTTDAPQVNEITDTAEAADTFADETDSIAEASIQPETAEETTKAFSGGGGGSSARRMIFFAEYTADLTENKELLDEINSKFILTDNTLICNDDEFNLLVDILNNNSITLNYVSERTDNNLITFIY